MPTCSNSTVEAAAAEEVAPLAADQAERCTGWRARRRTRRPALITLVLKLPHSPLSPVTTIDQRLRLSARGSRTVSSGWIDGSTRAATLLQHALHLHGVRPRVHDPLLRAAQLRRGDHLHRLGDLLRVLDRADPPPEIDQ